MKVENVFCEVFVAFNGRKPGYEEYKNRMLKEKRSQAKSHLPMNVPSSGIGMSPSRFEERK